MKRDHIAHVLNFHFKHGNYSSYRLQLGCDDSHIILLHSQGILCHAHFQCGWGEHMSQSCSKIAVLCLTLEVHRSIQEVSPASNIESVN